MFKYSADTVYNINEIKNYFQELRPKLIFATVGFESVGIFII